MQAQDAFQRRRWTARVFRRCTAWMTVMAMALSMAVQPVMAQSGEPGAAQTGAAAGQPEGGSRLTIVIVEGEGAVNNIRQRVAREPIVRIEDENRRPVAGAAVVFLLPGDGPGGVFADGSRMLTVQTDQAGQAVARGLRPNNVTGDFTIRVTASKEGQTTTAVIGQSNSLAGAAAGTAAGAAAGGISGKVLAILVVVGAAVAGGTYAATRGNDNGNGGGGARPPTGVSVGAPTVGAP
ncbi:MAG: hypothetical protein MUF01_06790 [Bryobacterales bacterium]|jgi:hypothetical protein|nr:hypothetical protein [Bryobacterales bacterium]